ncbi:xanthine dehydrogenase accessory protein XdhC [Rhizobium sp. CFBP 8762]|uniref:xanthine dehydrogenase accessory protein XdhC n=1 Tax=Rhizobium sp. CFBP 8762 TaxID=2775279 RepID=UPI001780BB9B|nr:xanthine dehydrogenase accessory protein XdhC [Rhizobium sp. CFBP 8762]MBD8556536.1 xanthine dehydrogenase accessory protein XdhC [Rhizobium sp. CFBP 8762]
MRRLKAFLSREQDLIIVTVETARGSTPREEGAVMLVSPTQSCGTIGGGHMEFLAVENARNLLAGTGGDSRLDIPLGPEIGQCCGGRVVLSFTHATPAARAELLDRLARREADAPQIWLFGGGHVSHALCDALKLLPVQVTVVESRASALDGLGPDTTTQVVAMPEAQVRDIPSGSAIVILTHDHAQDFLIAAEALTRDDLAFVGMIGSRTKRATFSNWFVREGGNSDHLARLTLPVGGTAVHDKRPEVIAALTAAELITVLLKDVPHV